MTAEHLGIAPDTITYWAFDSLDESRSPQMQATELKEDMAQARISSSVILDIGWYPSFDLDGAFTVSVIQDMDWGAPVFSKQAQNWPELRAIVAEALSL